MTWILLLAAAGLFLSAFFSGSETGFYRVPRVRLMLDALGGDVVSRALLWLANHASIFVATTLVGNNVANYITSLAIVMATQAAFHGEAHVAELLAPVILAPLLFVYGELFPKNLFLLAPSRLLRRGAPLFVVCVVLFSPVSLLLWMLDRLIRRLVRQSPEPIRLAVARRELRRMIEEGHDVGILRPVQRHLARGIFSMAKRPVIEFATPIGHFPRVRRDTPKEEVLGLARRHRVAEIPVEEGDGEQRLIGYLRVVDLALHEGDQTPEPRPFLEIPQGEIHLAALMDMQATQQTLARVVDEDGKTVGIVTARGLAEPLFRSGS